MSVAVRLVATDVDGTLVRDDHRTISPRTRAAFAAISAAGVAVMAISGREPYSIAAIVAGTALTGHVIGGNGSVAMDLRSGRIFFEEYLDVQAQTALAHGLLAHHPELKLVSVRKGGSSYVAEHGYHGATDPGSDDAAWPVERRFADRAEVLGTPSLKLVVRHPDPAVPPSVLLDLARALDVPGCHPTISGAPFMEVTRAGVTKASALARYTALHGIASEEVVVFGDNVNDVEMLRWAGPGVAMGNAVAEARGAADEVTATNEQDGVAITLERLLAAAGRPAPRGGGRGAPTAG